MTNPFTGFSIEKIVRHTSPESLQSYLQGRGGFEGKDLAKLKKQKKARAYGKAVSEELKALVKRDTKLCGDLMKVFVLARGNALVTFMHNYEWRMEPALVTQLNSLESCYDKAFLLIVKLREWAYRHYCVYTAEAESPKYWSLRDDYLSLGLSPLAEAQLEEIKAGILENQQKETRGNQCEYVFEEYRGKQYIFFRTGDLPKHEEVWKDGEEAGITLQPIYKIAVAFDYANGEIDVYCREKKTRTEIHKIIARKVFKKEIQNISPSAPLYSIEEVLRHFLANKRLNLQKPEGSPIKRIWLDKVLVHVARLQEKFTLESTADRKIEIPMRPDPLYFIFGHHLRLDASSQAIITLEDAHFSWLQFGVEYEDPDNDGKTLIKKFTFSGRDNANLGHSDIDHAIKDCLRMNGFIRQKEEGNPSSAKAKLA